jgi:hypothetical protein
MNKEDFAKSKYHGPEGYNCAQAVMAAFQDEFGLNDQDIASLKSAGGGRAEGGICGASYAAKALVKNPDFHAEIDKAFTAEGGSTACRQIRENGKMPCKECVGLAARLVAENLSAR